MSVKLGVVPACLYMSNSPMMFLSIGAPSVRRRRGAYTLRRRGAAGQSPVARSAPVRWRDWREAGAQSAIITVALTQSQWDTLPGRVSHPRKPPLGDSRCKGFGEREPPTGGAFVVPRLRSHLLSYKLILKIFNCYKRVSYGRK